MASVTYSLLQGKLVHANRAAVSVADRGFRFGDGVFETIRVEGGVPYQWELHYQRLLEGLSALQIDFALETIVPGVIKLLKKNAFKSGFVRIMVSRGVGSRGYLPYPPDMPASWVIETLPINSEMLKPCHLWLSSIAKIPRQCLPVNYKLAQGLNSTLALLEAQQHQCEEALLLTTDGWACEAASANLFWIKNNVLYTPALDTGCLKGTTRDAIMRLSPIEIRTVKTGIGAIEMAESVFLSNSRVGIQPVAQLLPRGAVFETRHPLLRELQTRLRADRADYTSKHRREWVGKR